MQLLWSTDIRDLPLPVPGVPCERQGQRQVLVIFAHLSMGSRSSSQQLSHSFHSNSVRVQLRLRRGVGIESDTSELEQDPVLRRSCACPA